MYNFGPFEWQKYLYYVHYLRTTNQNGRLYRQRVPFESILGKPYDQKYRWRIKFGDLAI